MDCTKRAFEPKLTLFAFILTVLLSLCSAADKTHMMYTCTGIDTSLSMASSYGGEYGFCVLCIFSKLESDQGESGLNTSRY